MRCALTWVLRLMLNGLGVYTTWCVIASLLNLTAALVYVGGVDQRAGKHTSK